MITDGRFYKELTGGNEGNKKYSPELKRKIEEAGQLCLDNLKNSDFSPIMMMGNIQSGKTRGFIGLMSLCYDNDFDMTIILTKCSKALVQQTVSRMMSEFDGFKTGMSTVGDVVAQDILDIDFQACVTMEQKEAVVKKFLKRYKGKKRIIVVKKQADNVDRLNLFIESIVKNEYYKRLLIVDDEADITSVGFQKDKGRPEISLRRISGSINTMRKALHSNIEHVLMQVTATPYALYLQPGSFLNNNIMPIKPQRTVVLPTGKGYIGGQYYFLDSEDEESENYAKAKFLPYIVPQDEMSILNGSAKNSSKNSVIRDKRTVKMANFLSGQSEKSTFVLPSLRKWIFDILVGTALIQLNPEYENYYVSAVLHAAIAKSLHKNEKALIEEALEILNDALEDDVNNPDFSYFVKTSYEDLIQSVKEYDVLQVATLEEVQARIASLDEDNELIGLINEVDVKEINSDNDITRLLNITTGELKLENSLTIFVGGQVLDRGITIPNMISFFYGRDPATMQQDTVMQHCRMFGYRGSELLSVTRFYTTYRLFSSMKEITIRDNLLRERMETQSSGEVVYLESGGKIKSCSPQKVLASNIHSILPEKRYLPVGFDIKKKEAKNAYKKIDAIITKYDGYLPENRCMYKKDEPLDDLYVRISSNDALQIMEYAYSALEGKDDGSCNQFTEMESVFLFSLSERMINHEDEIALIVRKNRDLSKMKRNGMMYQDAPDDGKNEGAIAKLLREKMPVLVLTEQMNPEWGSIFWWPVYYTPNDMNVGLYSDEHSKNGIIENSFSAGSFPMRIDSFKVIDEFGIGIDDKFIHTLTQCVREVQDYFKSAFYIPEAVLSEKKRKSVECPIVIGDGDFFGNYNLQEEIETIMQETKSIFDCIEISDDMTKEKVEQTKRDMLDYLQLLAKENASDDIRNALLKAIESLQVSKLQKDRIKGLIYRTDELTANVFETFGMFYPIGVGACEIHLNLPGIEKECMRYADSDESTLKFMCMVLAHEMFHALHYADVMTESGRWLYKNQDVMKQGAVKEAMAEYFTLCFAKQGIPCDGEMDMVEYMRSIRNIDDYPRDGGYSGALILEGHEVENLAGNQNEKFVEVYADSMRDMPKAFEKITV